MRLRQDFCEILLGYLVSHPWSPSARSPAGGQVLERAFAFARGAAVGGRLQGRRAACRAAATVEPLLRDLGATRAMATAFHERLLDERPTLRRC